MVRRYGEEGSMSNIIDTLITVIIGSLTGVSKNLSSGLSALEDFFYVKVRGLSFIVLGSRQTGKTTLIEWLRRNMASIENFDPDPTAAGGHVIPDFASKLDDGKYLKVKPTRDVGGEYAMWETDWVELFREAQPRGILFMIDHTEAYLHKDALNFVLQMIDDEPSSARNLKAFYVVINKSDLWEPEMSLDDIMQYYRTEQRRLKNQAEKLGYAWAIVPGSVKTGAGIRETMEQFFNHVRPKPKD
jgi:hypothetical protein